MKKIEKEKELLIISLYENGEDNKAKIGRIVGVDPKTVVKFLRKNSITFRQRPKYLHGTKKYSVNNSYFSVIDTEEKAYFLGLLYADGNNRGSGFSISLQAEDKYILENLKNAIEYSGVLYYRKPRKVTYKEEYSLYVTSQQISEDLTKHGCVMRKTHISDFPIGVPEYLIHHFLRGHFDGDGCIYINKTGYPRFDIIGNNLLISKIQKVLVDNCSLIYKKLRPNRIDRQNTIVIMSYSNKENIKKIFNYLYKDATIFLTRKKEKFEKI